MDERRECNRDAIAFPRYELLRDSDPCTNDTLARCPPVQGVSFLHERVGSNEVGCAETVACVTLDRAKLVDHVLELKLSAPSDQAHASRHGLELGHGGRAPLQVALQKLEERVGLVGEVQEPVDAHRRRRGR